MFEHERSSTYERVYEELVTVLKEIDLKARAEGLGALLTDDGLEIMMFGEAFVVTPAGVEGRRGRPVPVRKRIILCRYVIQGGSGNPSGRWVAYREFKDSAFFMATFRAQAEDRLARHFKGRLVELERSCMALGGLPHKGEMGGDLCFEFAALPKVPLLLIFYDGDEELPPGASVLFDRNADRFLDMECLAVLGWILADQLMDSHIKGGSKNQS